MYNHSRDLEGINLTSSSVSSPCSEEVSVREQLDALRISGRVATDKKDERNVEASLSAYLRDVRRLEEKVDALSRSKDIVLKRMKDIEAHSFKQKQVEEVIFFFGLTD